MSKKNRFRAKDRLVQKMTRDGLIQQNQATGEKERISSRLADVSFHRDRVLEKDSGGPPISAGKRRKQPRPIRQTAEKTAYAVPVSQTAPAPSAPSMRMAADAPMMDISITEAPPPPAFQRRRRRKSRKKAKRRQAAKHTLDAARPLKGRNAPSQTAGDKPVSRTEQREPSAAAEKPASDKKRQVIKSAAQVAAHTQSEPPPAMPPPEPKEETPPVSRKYQKAVRRVERAERQAARAQDALPAKRRLSFQPEVDSKTGRTRRRLHFEREILPEYRKPSLPARAGGMVKTAAVMKLHGKIHESERDNVAVEAAHKSELFMEQGVGRVLRWQRNRRRSKPYRTLRQAERRAARERVKLAWQTALRDNPELRRKNAFAKWMQKQKIKRQYAQAARGAAQFPRPPRDLPRRAVQTALRQVSAYKLPLALAGLLALTAVLFSTGLTSCAAVCSGVQSALLSSTYTASEGDISRADLYFSELETNLRADIDATETGYPGYGEYRYQIGEIGHDPYMLMAYLSAAFDSFTFEQVRPELDRLFAETYQLTRTEMGDILQTTLTVRPLADVIAETLAPGEQTDRYNLYLQTFGNRQIYGSPFDFPWLEHISSRYGYRIHPITGEKKLHKGVDVAAAEGTPVAAVHDGQVSFAGDAGSYGMCVVIEDAEGRLSRYAHCSSLFVSAGQAVRRGDIIAAVGSTGQSTGPHLHLEIMLNGELLNPLYFVDGWGRQ